MNHDATHCLDYNPKRCPMECYRAQMTEELKHRNDLYYLPLSWSHLEGTEECEKKEGIGKMSRKVDENGWLTYTTQNDPIEYAPVKHGHWEVIGQPYMRKHFNPVCCSLCKRRGYNTPYCPYCGAKMDGVEE